MKLHNILITLLFISASNGFAQLPSFNYKRKVKDVFQEGWYRIVLTPEIFKHINQEFGDLRLYSINEGDTTEIPCLLNIRETKIKKNDLQLALINQSKKDGALYLGFELPKGEKTNFIDLSFEEENFFAFVTIEGSENRKEWFGITDEQRIFSVQNNYEHYKNGVVHFPVAGYKYLRVSVKSDTPLTFRSALFQHQQVEAGTFENISLQWNTVNDKRAKKSVITATLDHYRPVSNLEIKFGNNHDFYRSAEIAVLADSFKTEKGWLKNYTTVYSGYVTSYNANIFNLGFQLSSEIRITVFNNDNIPLAIETVTASGASVELQAKLTSANTFLFYGNKSVGRPSYDIDHFREKIPAIALVVGLGSEENIAFAQRQASALFKNKFWLWGIMIAVIGVLGLFTLLMMKGKESSRIT